MNTELYATTDANLLMKCLAGSRLYGTNRPDSDYDLRGVCWTPKQVLLGLTKFEQYERHGDEDITVWTLARFFGLAQDNNPNILDILCAPPSSWLVYSPAWKLVYGARSLFLSENVRYRFSGYAISQLKRLEGHHRWLVNPPKREPILEEYSGYLETNPKGGQKLQFADEDDRTEYSLAAREWQQYQTWLAERNPARAELERKFGYDTKHGAHLVRLMRQAKNLLETGDYNPVLSGATKEIVLAVLNGCWKYESLMVWAEAMDLVVKEMPTVLPKNPDRNAIESLLVELQEKHLKEEW
jgi:uncharacterized protein